MKFLGFLDSRKANEAGKQERKAEGQHKAASRVQLLPLSLLEQLQDANHDVIDVTKARSLEERETPTALE